MLDLVLVVKDSEDWHKANLERSAPTVDNFESFGVHGRGKVRSES